MGRDNVLGTARRIDRGVLADQVYEELMVNLIDGQLDPGTPLSIDGIARELNVSATPVREALARLETTGMVRRVALKGYRVSPPLSVEEILQLLEARAVIEPVNAELACARLTPEFIDSLEENLRRQSEAPTESTFSEYKEFWAADEEFHRLIAEQAGNRFLLAAYDALGGQIQRFRQFGNRGVRDSGSAMAEHQAIAEALRTGEPTKAHAAMTSHIHNIRTRALKGE